MIEQLVETWNINNRVNLQLLENLSDEAMRSTLSTRGGRTVGHQLAHLFDVRRTKLEKIDKALVAKLPEITREDGHDKKLLAEGFRISGEIMSNVIRDSAANGRKVKGFKRGIVVMVGYFINHEAHHRGHIMLTLKQSKIKRNDFLKYGIWAWNQI